MDGRTCVHGDGEEFAGLELVAEVVEDVAARPRPVLQESVQGYLAREKTPPPLGQPCGPRQRPTVGS